MRIALDLMGSERGPSAEVKGALVALEREPDLTVVLVGTREGLKTYKKKIENNHRLEVVEASQVVQMDTSPSEALKTMTSSTIAVGLDLVKKGEADGFVSAGNTGAVMAFSLFSLGRIEGIKRPALATTFPTPDGGQNLVLDVGANVEAKSTHLKDYAVMGRIIMEKIYGVKNPKVGLLNVGQEEGKGNQLALETHKLLADASVNFAGNVEGTALFRKEVDVVVTDGFTGNTMLKAVEGMGATVLSVLKDTARKYRVRGWLSKKGFRDFAEGMNYEKEGGAMLLGVQGTVIISHGRSSARAIKNAVRLAAFACRERVVDAIKEEFKS